MSAPAAKSKAGMPLDFPPLLIDFDDDGCATLTDPTDDGSGNQWRVRVHPMQVQVIAEHYGLLSTAAQPSGPSVEVLRVELETQKSEIDTLKRKLLRIWEHSLQCHKAMAEADWDHADLTYEMGKINALVDLCDMAVDDFRDDYVSQDPPVPKSCEPAEKPTANPAVTHGKPTGNPAKTRGMSEPASPFQWALRQRLEKSSTKFVLTAMAARADDKDRAALTTQELAELTGQDRKTVLENIKRLTEIGLIVDTGEREGASKAVPVFLLATEKEYEPGKTEQLELSPALEGGS